MVDGPSTQHFIRNKDEMNHKKSTLPNVIRENEVQNARLNLFRTKYWKKKIDLIILDE